MRMSEIFLYVGHDSIVWDALEVEDKILTGEYGQSLKDKNDCWLEAPRLQVETRLVKFRFALGLSPQIEKSSELILISKLVNSEICCFKLLNLCKFII